MHARRAQTETCTSGGVVGEWMTSEYEPTLAAALAALLQERGATVVQVARAAGLRRNTVDYILSGKTRRPPPETLHALALGLATDPLTGNVDHWAMVRAERMLAFAAGYADPTAREARTLTELGLYYELSSLERARAWRDAIDALSSLSPDEIGAMVGRQLGAC